ncbi:unknown protein [Desulfotalea psychrophila LSv54]|uniref:Uncharacterized protein n=1 Tax=Desulfotalea psychrophila (strain LSv54 / DSM 12343) TaxID=177439 RepID=Q6AJG7_DESPS|nr:unknown protein [Desulfotalea psychrophila LSv54]
MPVFKIPYKYCLICPEQRFNVEIGLHSRVEGSVRLRGSRSSQRRAVFANLDESCDCGWRRWSRNTILRYLGGKEGGDLNLSNLITLQASFSPRNKRVVTS